MLAATSSPGGGISIGLRSAAAARAATCSAFVIRAARTAPGQPPQ
jgi:hypothetical protein